MLEPGDFHARIVKYDEELQRRRRRPSIFNMSIMNQKQDPLQNGKTCQRVRSASTGRDKKSEIQARYWAFLFGNLQRSINEIYQTVECYENLPSCQEAILVLENYIRDFKALAEWFKVSWDYETTPLPQRPHSLAWEVRKSNPTPTRVRSRTLTSPTISGNSSPSFSGKNSPCQPIDERSSPKKFLNRSMENGVPEGDKKLMKNEHTEPMQNVSTQQMFILKLDQYTQTNLEDDCLTLADYVAKYSIKNIPEQTNDAQNEINNASISNQNSNADKISVCDSKVAPKLASEVSNETVKTEAKGPPAAKPVIMQSTLNRPKKVIPNGIKEVPKTASSISSKPKLAPANCVKKSLTALHLPVVAKQETIPFRNKFVSSNEPKTASNRTNAIQKPSNGCAFGSRLPARSKTMIEVRTNKKPAVSNVPLKNRPWVDEVDSSSSTLKASNDKLEPKKTNAPHYTKPLIRMSENSRKSEPKQMSSNESTDDGWLTVKNRRRSSLHWASRFNQPSGSASLPTLSVIEDTPPETKDVVDSKGVKDNINTATKKKVISQNKTESLQSTAQNLRNSKPNVVTKRNDKPVGVESKKILQPLSDRLTDLEKAAKVTNKRNVKSAQSTTVENSIDSAKPANILNKRIIKSAQIPTELDKSKTIYSELLSLTADDAEKNWNLLNMKGNKSAQSKVLSDTEKTVNARNVNTDSITDTEKSNKLAIVDNKRMNTRTNADRFADIERVVRNQRTELTGLNMKSLRKEYLRSDKYMNRFSNNINVMDVTVEEKSVVLQKVDMNIQTNMLSSTIDDLYNNCLNSGKTINDVLSCDDLEEKEDPESDEDQKKLLEEQESLERQIRELQNTEFDIDTETDETDCEAIIDLENDDNESSSEKKNEEVLHQDEIPLEMRYEDYLADMSWIERMEALATLEALVARYPGRAQQLHQKLSSPSRRRSLHETVKKYQAKQSKALEKRESLRKEKALKIQQLLARVEDVKAAKQQLIEEKRMKMEGRLQRAAENRNQYLKDKVRKAHDEEEKLKEIAFIKNIEAQNKILDFLELCKEQEGRLQDLEHERLKRAEEKAAKEAAVERRRLEIELERQKRLEKMSETRRERERRVGKMQEQKEKMRQAIARDKARDREERLQALQAQQLATTEELQRKITQKQIESARRHEENIEHIRQRALELTIPRNTDELRTNEDEEDEIQNSINKSKEIMKSAKKKLKKLKSRMSQSAEEYLGELQPLPAHIRKDSQVSKLLNMISKGGSTAVGIERPLGQLLRLITKAQVADFHSMWLLDGLGVISTVIDNGMTATNSDISKKAIIQSVQLYRNCCSLCPQIARHAILGNSVTTLLNALLISLQTPEEISPSHPVELSTELLLACTVALSPTNAQKQSHPKVVERLPDIISYAVAIGLVNSLTRRILLIRESIEDQQSVVLSVLSILGLLTKMAEICPKESTDVTKFLTIMDKTQFFGSLSLVYTIIVPNGENIPAKTMSLVAAAFNLLVTLAYLNIEMFQEILSDEFVTLKFLDVIKILMKYCMTKATEKGEIRAVIIDVLVFLGFLCANQRFNQDILTSEKSTIILKSITKLPSEYDISVYPTLVAFIHDNEEARAIVAKDFNVDLLDEYKKSEMAKKNKIVALLKTT